MRCVHHLQWHRTARKRLIYQGHKSSKRSPAWQEDNGEKGHKEAVENNPGDWLLCRIDYASFLDANVYRFYHLIIQACAFLTKLTYEFIVVNQTYAAFCNILIQESFGKKSSTSKNLAKKYNLDSSDEDEEILRKKVKK